MTRLGEKQKSAKPNGAQYTVNCYFERGLRFRPDDTTLRMLYANYLHKNNRDADAKQHMADAVRRAGDNGFTHYNAGLMYVELKDYDLALVQSHKAIELGFTRPELPAALKKASKWREPAAGTAGAGVDAASAPSAAASPSR